MLSSRCLFVYFGMFLLISQGIRELHDDRFFFSEISDVALKRPISICVNSIFNVVFFNKGLPGI